jgi:GT2 family glycosyltransferase
MYYPDAVVTHKIGGSSDAAADRMIWEHSRSMWRLFNKHKAFFAERVPLYARPLVLPGLFLRAIMRIVKRRFLTEEQKKTWRR